MDFLAPVTVNGSKYGMQVSVWQTADTAAVHRAIFRVLCSLT